MTKYKSGQEHIDEMGIKDFEFFKGFVKKGAKPSDNLGRPLNPSDVIKDVSNYHDLIDKASTMTDDDPEANEVKTKIKNTTESINASQDVDWNDFELPASETEAEAILTALKGSLYHQKEIDKLKSSAGIRPERALTHDQRCKIECRKVAERLWAEDRHITIRAMSQERQEILDVSIKKDGTHYLEATVRNWIKDLCPDRSAGRRPDKIKK